MNEREKEDQEQLEYLREWKENTQEEQKKKVQSREFARKVGNYGRKNF